MIADFKGMKEISQIVSRSETENAVCKIQTFSQSQNFTNCILIFTT